MSDRFTDFTYTRPPGYVEGSPDKCFLCGRTLLRKTGIASILDIHLSTGGGLIPVDQADGSDDDQGWFPIGTECAKKLPAAYVMDSTPHA